MKIAVWDPQLDADLELLAKHLGKTVDETVRIAVVEKLRRDLPNAAGVVDWNEVRRTMSVADVRAFSIIGLPTRFSSTTRTVCLPKRAIFPRRILQLWV